MAKVTNKTLQIGSVSKMVMVLPMYFVSQMNTEVEELASEAGTYYSPQQPFEKLAPGPVRRLWGPPAQRCGATACPAAGALATTPSTSLPPPSVTWALDTGDLPASRSRQAPKGADFPRPTAPEPCRDEDWKILADAGSLAARSWRAASDGRWVGHTPVWECKGAPAREEGRQRTRPRAIQIPGGRVHVGAQRLHVRPRRADVRWSQRRLPLARAGRRREGRRPPRPVRAASPRRQPASAPSAGHTQHRGRRRGLGGPDCGARGRAEPPSPPRRPRRVCPRSASRRGQAGVEGVPGGGDRGSWLTSMPSVGRSVPGRGREPGARSPGVAPWQWRPLQRGGRAEREPLLGRAPSRARPALPALAAESAAGSAPGLDSFTDTTPTRPAPRRDTPAPRRLPPPAGPPASPPLSVTHQAHTPRAGAPRSCSHTQRCSRLSRVLYPLTRTF
ncbi:uncharacterized protein LOC144365726 [Ictidomys tridecemlineatus]